jgi:DNA-binding NarL/FixJ family response regulator
VTTHRFKAPQVGNAGFVTPAPAGTTTTRVVVADDFDAMRRLVRIYLEEPGSSIEVVAEIAQTAGLDALVAHERPDVVLLDLHLSGRDEIDAVIRALRTAAPDAAVLLFSGLPGDMLADEAQTVGADGHVAKDWDAERIRNAVQRAARSRPFTG